MARDHVGIALDSAARLGRRTAELHLALASPTGDAAFSPEPLGGDDVQPLLADLRGEAARVFDLLKDSVAGLPDELVDLAGMVLGRRRHILDRFRVLSGNPMDAQRIRIHGDYHLGQVLRAKTDYQVKPATFLNDRALTVVDCRFSTSAGHICRPHLLSGTELCGHATQKKAFRYFHVEPGSELYFPNA